MKNKRTTVKIILPLVVVLVVLLIVRLTRHVTPISSQMLNVASVTTFQAVDPALASALTERLESQINQQNALGFQAAMVNKEGAIWQAAVGTTDLRRATPLQQNDLIRIGSVTKVYTAVLIFQLIEQDALALDDTLDQWFPEVPNAEQITIRQLLNHTSGLSEFIPQILFKSILPNVFWQPQEIGAIIENSTPLAQPGQAFHYSNANYVLLGWIAERVSHQSYAELLQNRIFTPLQLENTVFLPTTPIPSSLQTGYDRDLSHFPGMLTISPNNSSWASSAIASGALAANAADLALFFDALFNEKLISSESLAYMQTFLPVENPGFDAQIGQGLGLMELNIAGTAYVGHLGQFMGATALAVHSSFTGDTIVIITNLSSPNLAEVIADLQSVLYAQ